MFSLFLPLNWFICLLLPREQFFYNDVWDNLLIISLNCTFFMFAGILLRMSSYLLIIRTNFLEENVTFDIQSVLSNLKIPEKKVFRTPKMAFSFKKILHLILRLQKAQSLYYPILYKELV